MYDKFVGSFSKIEKKNPFIHPWWKIQFHILYFCGNHGNYSKSYDLLPDFPIPKFLQDTMLKLWPMARFDFYDYANLCVVRSEYLAILIKCSISCSFFQGRKKNNACFFLNVKLSCSLNFVCGQTKLLW